MASGVKHTGKSGGAAKAVPARSHDQTPSKKSEGVTAKATDAAREAAKTSARALPIRSSPVGTAPSLRSKLATLKAPVKPASRAQEQPRVKPKSPPFARNPVLQELEPRLLMSADLNPALQDTVFASPALGGAEFRNIADHGTPTVVTSAAVAPIQRTNELVFVDTATPDYQKLIDEMRASALGQGRHLEFVLIDHERDGIRKITDTLAQKRDLDAVHIISHAHDGAVQLGRSALDFETLVKRAAAVKKWGSALTENGDILFYGCDLAATEKGKSLLEAMSRLTGADVAASEDLTGAAAKGGDWELEFKSGAIESDLVVSEDFDEIWQGLLTNVTVTNNNDVVNGTTTSIAALIAAPGADGISLREAITAANNTTGADTVLFNVGGGGAQTITITAGTPLPGITGALTIDGTSQGGYAGTPLIRIDGNNAVTNGLVLNGATSSSSHIRALAITRFSQDGIRIVDSSFNVIAGNYIGTEGTNDLGNGNDGIEITSATRASNNTIGGTGANDRNVIAGNNTYGVRLNGAGVTDNVIEGNYLGTRANGTLAPGTPANVQDAGVRIEAGADRNVVGGTATASRNVISANALNGVVISGAGTTGNAVQGNYIGTTNAGTATLANGTAVTDAAVLISGGASGNLIGGAATGARNVIAGNNGDGVRIDASDSNFVQGNAIGVDAGGGARANTGDGVELANDADLNMIGGTAAAAGNNIRNNALHGIRVSNNNADGNSLLGNSIFANTLLGIDLNKSNNAVDANDAAPDNDAQGNDAQNYPTALVVTTNGTLIRIQGTLVSANSTTYRVEFFSSSAGDASGNGEGERYIGFTTVTTSGVGTGTFDVTFNVAVAAGQRISATATNPGGSTSEFSAHVNAAAGAVAGNTISGSLYEDVDGDADIGEAGTQRIAGATVLLYRDTNANNTPDAADALVTSAVTDALGNYALAVSTNATYWVVVDSRTIGPSAGYSAGFSIGDLWAEQTYAVGGAASGAGFTGALGALYGGRNPNASDNASAAATAEHLIRVVYSGASIGGIDSGFTFNVVTNLLAGDATDHDGGNPRTVQGSLRQFIQNANAIGGGNTMRFVPVVGANQSAGADTWWQLAVTTALPQITGANTVIDGTAYQAAVNGAVRDTNTGSIGAGGFVGTGADGVTGTGDEIALGQVARPELEIHDAAGTTIGIGLDVNAASVAIQDLSIWGFGTGVAPGAPIGNIVVRDVSGALIQSNVIGTGAHDFVDPGAGARSAGPGVFVDSGDNGILQSNLIGFNGFAGAHLASIGNEPNNWQILGNEIRGNGQITNIFDGVNLNGVGGSTVVQGNLITGNLSPGIDVPNASGTLTIDGNTISNNAAGAGAEQSGIIVRGGTATTTISHNVVSGNTGSGVLIANTGTARITQNSISGNTGAPGLGIDLVPAAATVGNGVTANDAAGTWTATDRDPDGGANALQNYPVLTGALTNGTQVRLVGALDSTGSTTYRLEFFASAAGDASGFGEGQRYLGFVDVAANAAGHYDLDTTQNWAVAAGEVISVTATNLTTLRTSEFGPNVTALAGGAISGTIYNDVNGDADVTDAGTLTVAGASVYIFRDTAGGGAGTPDATDVFVGTAVTNGAGVYNTGPLTNATYWVVVDSKTISAAGYNGGFGLTSVWAEQTYGDNFATAALDLNARYGGRNAAQSDNASTAAANLATSEHLSRVDLAGANVTGVDSGFSFNVVVNTRGDATDDDGGATGRLHQGSFRQFILNSEAIAGVQASNFSINYPAGGAQTIALAAALPTITDAVILDATTQEGFAGAPVIELNGAGAGAGASGLVLAAGSDGSTVRGFVINRFDQFGIWIESDGNTIAGNWIGLDATGALPAGNGVDGISVNGGATNNTIGGTGAADRNVISANLDEGIAIDGADGTLVIGNYIGTNAAGTVAFGNRGDGISIQYGATNTTVGGTTAAERNVISGNGWNGPSGEANVRIRSALGPTFNNVVLGNNIGTDAAGTTVLANPAYGVLLTDDTWGNTIGGTAPGAGNIIAGSALAGVAVSGAGTVGNAILGNSIYSNANLGIDLDANNIAGGVTPNDSGDGDPGPNDLQNFPLLQGAGYDGTNLTIRGQLDTDVGTYRIEFFASSAADPSGYGEGRRYLGSTTVTVAAPGTVAFTSAPFAPLGGITAGEVITATATVDLGGGNFGSTSEFSAALYTVTGRIYEDVNGDASLADAVGRNGVDVRLFLDNGAVAGSPDATDTLGATATTYNPGAAAGTYLLFAPSGQSFVVIDSRDITPNAGYAASGFVGGSAADDVWADQTYAFASAVGPNSVQAVWHNGVAYQFQTSAGSLYGGLIVGRSDDGLTLNIAGAAPGAEHIQRLTIAAGGTGLSGVDSGFSFNAITNTRGDNADDSGGDRMQQGSLRQFIRNSNAIGGVQTSNFSIDFPTGGGAQTIAPTAAFDSISNAVVLDATTQEGFSGTPLIELNGTGAGGANGLTLASTGSTVRGFVINRFSNGIRISGDNNLVAGNWIGLDATGSVDRGNGTDGIILVAGAADNTIGGTTANDRNVISGNNDDGVSIDGASGTIVIGNYIGTDAQGTAAVGNSGDGVAIQLDNFVTPSTNTTVGGTSAAERNVISGNAANSAQGLANVRIRGAGTTGNVVLGNYIGTDYTGAVALANPRDGIVIDEGALNNTIGGAVPGAGNVISGSTNNGIRIQGTYSYAAGDVLATIYGNRIGTNAAGTAALANAQSGIFVDGSSGTTATAPQRITIGGTGANQGNTIAFNAQDGVAVTVNASRVTIVGNSIYSNGSGAGDLGIDLAANGVTNNDGTGPYDGDTGPNTLQNFPAFSAVTTDGTTLTVSGRLDSIASTTYTIHFYASTAIDPSGHGEGQRYLGSTTVLTDAAGTVFFNNLAISAAVAIGEWVSMTATDPSGNTSEFSASIAVNTPPVNTVPVAQIVQRGHGARRSRGDLNRRRRQPRQLAQLSV